MVKYQNRTSENSNRDVTGEIEKVMKPIILSAQKVMTQLMTYTEKEMTILMTLLIGNSVNSLSHGSHQVLISLDYCGVPGAESNVH